jgi:hypothetical protein
MKGNKRAAGHKWKGKDIGTVSKWRSPKSNGNLYADNQYFLTITVDAQPCATEPMRWSMEVELGCRKLRPVLQDTTYPVHYFLSTISTKSGASIEINTLRSWDQPANERDWKAKVARLKHTSNTAE